MKQFVVFLAVFGVLGAPSWGQTTFQEQANRLQNINAYLLDLRPAGFPLVPERNRLELVFDLNPQPTINTRVGNKDEPVDPPSVVPKLRGRYYFGKGFMLGGSFAPGIEFEDYKAETIALELAYRKQLLGLNFSLRASYGDGNVKGPITEPGAEDDFEFRNTGLDLSVGKGFEHWQVYGFVGGNDIETSLDIQVDGVHLDNEDSTLYLGAGVAYLWDHWGVTLEQNLTDDYLQHLILSISYRL